jgi:hypothetical protein
MTFLMATQNSTRLAKFLGQHTLEAKLLPVVRTATVNAFDAVMDHRLLILNQDNLLHFFYGKPSYKLSNNSDMPSRFLNDAGVCFVFDLKSLPPLHGLFALDTGAFRDKRYDNFLPNGVVLADFELPLEHESLPRLVAAFFGSNENYYEGIARDGLKISPLDRASEAYANIIRSSVIDHLDERACTAEIQLNVPVDIARAKLLTVVLPGRLYEDPEVKNFIDIDLKIRPILYRFRRAKPQERTEVIYQKLGEYLDHEGYF